MREWGSQSATEPPVDRRPDPGRASVSEAGRRPGGPRGPPQPGGQQGPGTQAPPLPGPLRYLRDREPAQRVAFLNIFTCPRHRCAAVETILRILTSSAPPT